MKGKLLTIGFSTVLVSILICSIVYATGSTLGTGYAVTSNIEGTEVESGTPVTITASTLDPKVTKITFRWLGPPDGNGDCVWEETVPVVESGTYGQWNDGTPAEVLYATSTYPPTIHGEWSVEVIFRNSKGDRIAKLLRLLGIIEQVRGTDIEINEDYPFFAVRDMDIERTEDYPFFVVPEIPLGTIGATVAMAAALGLFAIKKKRTTK
jgi:hypothetical protein